ncbi:hypothetical protein HDV02_002128 [Globomyces sp. JEL0801]|nr:hypothetical protein HDV02_002128 [Globomyces sp. JEL0801]
MSFISIARTTTQSLRYSRPRLFNTSVILKSNIQEDSTSKPKFKTNSVDLADDGIQKIMSVSDTGFQLEDMKVKGPLIVLNSTVLLWDVPQYGVGGPTGDVEPLEKGTQQAATTFKILSQEGRNVSLALLPPFPTSARSGKLLVEVYTSSN